MGRSNTKRKKRQVVLSRYYGRYGFPRDRNNQALPQVLHLWGKKPPARGLILFRRARRKYFKHA